MFQPAKWSAGHECDWVQHKERYLTLSSSVFDSVKSTRKPDNFSIYMQKYRLIEHFFVIENDWWFLCLPLFEKYWTDLASLEKNLGTKTFETNIPFKLITLIRRKCSMTSFCLKTSSRASVKSSKMRKSGCSLRGRRFLLGQLKYDFLIGEDSLYHRLAI